MNVRKAVITAAGRQQRQLPLQTLVDRDGSPESSTTFSPAASDGSTILCTGGAPVTFRGATSLTTRRCMGVP